MKKVVVSLVSAAALASFTLGMAATANSTVASDDNAVTNDNSNSGLYVGGNVGYGKFNVNNQNTTDEQKKGFTWNADLGYQFNQNFALEGGYTHFSRITTNGTIPADDIYGLDLAAKGILPLNDQFNVFAKAGAMRLSYKTILGNHTNKIVPELGVGAAYNITNNIALTAQGVTTLAIKSGSTTMPQTYAGYAGINYRFDI